MKNIKCRACENIVEKFLSLGEIPLVNHFLKKDEISSEEKFDLSVGFCPNCYLVQLMHTVPPKKLFREYIYFSSTSSIFLAHCKEVAQKLVTKLDLSSQKLVLEIASNDGAQLQCFKELGTQVLGVDPARNIAEVANKKGIPTISEFFNYELAQKMANKQGIKADLIFGANVLAHVPEILDFVKGIKVVLGAKGTAVFEFPHLKGLLEKKFDIIYHEHVFYYSLLALINLFQKADLEIYDVEITPMQGGSLQIFVAHPGFFKISKKVTQLVDEEITNGFDKLVTYQKIGQSINHLKSDLIDLLEKLKSKGVKIAAYGAPAKGNVLLNYFGVGENYLDFIVDKSEVKQGLYTPGTHLLVYPVDKIYQDKPDCLIILCWNIADEVMGQLKDYHHAGGKFIIPLPEPKLI